MAIPSYFAEKRYSYHVYGWTPPTFGDYQAADPQTTFEKQVQSLYTTGYSYMRDEEYYLALNSFRELQNLILTTVHPTLPIDIFRDPSFVFPLDASMVDAFAAKVGRELSLLPIKTPGLPDSVMSKTSLPDPVAKKLSLFESTGLAVSSQRAQIDDLVDQGLAAVQRSSWKEALSLFTEALKLSPDNDPVTRASLLHDSAVLCEKSGLNPREAAGQAVEAARLFDAAKDFRSKVHALETLAGIQTRMGNADAAAATIKQATDIVKNQRLFDVIIQTKAVPNIIAINRPVKIGGGINLQPVAEAALDPALSAAALPQVADAPVLFGKTILTPSVAEKTFRVSPSATAATTLNLAGDVTANVKAYFKAISLTDDLSLVQVFDLSYVEIVAYLPSMYFFVIPMAIGDCLVGLGNYAEAQQQYLSTLTYPFINLSYEAVNLWGKLASTCLELGDQAYRNAKDDVSQYPAAAAFYQSIIKSDHTLDAASPLYQSATFAQIKSRVQNFIAAGLAPTFNDNPALMAKVLEANVKLNQIALGLNFFGFSPDYAPPFSFEYLQNTAKYFAEQASHIEGRYIQFKTSAESQTLQREQLDQQADVARQTVILEQRGLAEAQAGMATAQANLDYAKVQAQNALGAQNQFNAVSSELTELSGLEAWANAASVGQDDEVQLTISNYSFYNVDHKRRSLVVQDLETRRTLITNNLESARLGREVAAANAYQGVAQAQVKQAQAREDIATQRIAIAQLQQRNAEENRDFMDLKEFSAHLWYDLAREAKRLTQRYLDMATEIAFLTERAYNAETERGLNVIRFDYRFTSSGNLLGADQLLADLDYFTFDLVTTTRSKKAPVKRIISLADSFPTAFQQLISTGTCNFQTSLAMFDRQAPGLYLCKTRYVELQFIGITNAALAGTLRNGGVSSFRRVDGSIITRMYPADVMPVSIYDIRQDALAFPINPNELRLFENNGIETQWQIDLPRSANDFDYADILDVQLVLYYDGFFSPALEQTVKAALPAGGSVARALSLRLLFPDELFYLKSNGEAKMVLDASLFPRTQKNMTRTELTLKVSGSSATNLTLHFISQNHGADLKVITDANGLVAGSAAGDPLGALIGEPLLDTWTIRITAADNPALATAGQLDLRGITDISFYIEYNFLYQ